MDVLHARCCGQDKILGSHAILRQRVALLTGLKFTHWMG
jgi:hypothetical protein